MLSRGWERRTKNNTTQHDTRDTKIQKVERSKEQEEPTSAQNEWADKYNTQRCLETLIEERKEKKRFH
jgi:hypothetical protein